VDAAEVAAMAHRVETVRLGRQSGIQDQLAAAHGGVNRIDMTEYPSAVVTPIALDAGVRVELERRLLLVFLGRSHVSSAVHEEVIASLEGADPSVVDARLEPLRAAARAGAEALDAGDLEAYGAALVANTDAQRRLHDGLVGPEARRLFDAASAAGASGWKVNGAGGDGGSVTILCGPDPSSRDDVLAAVARAGRAFVPIATTLDGDGLRVSPSGGAG
jgi:D-glycero-alpha-D-manno-heptose-7-phosphate kinase